MTRKRQTLWILGLLISAGLLYSAERVSHLLLPNLWLPDANHAIAQTPATRYVDPHLYDQEWFDAARAGRLDISQALLKAGYPINAQTGAGYTALILATYHGQNSTVAALLDAGANPCLADQNGNTALMGALFKGENQVARLLLNKCPVDQMNNAGQTALSFAALFGRLDFFDPLIALGADPQHRDYQGDSLIALMQKQGNQPAAAALQKALLQSQQGVKG